MRSNNRDLNEYNIEHETKNACLKTIGKHKHD